MPKGVKLDDALIKETASVYLKHGSNISAASRELGISRQALHNRLSAAEKAGLLEPRPAEANLSRWRPWDELVGARKKEFARVKAAGDGRRIHPRPLADDGPFLAIPLGDPHLDSPGTDLGLWERWTLDTIAKAQEAGVDAHLKLIGLGDWTDNWPRFLAFLYGYSETPAPEGWILLEGYLDRIAPYMEASVSGNHDDWSNPTDLLGKLMRDRGVLHRQCALRVGFQTPQGRMVTFGLRHRFLGNSQWNPAHAVTKAAQLGWRDTVLVGGDKHISGHGLVRCPDTGRLTWCYQVAAFKTHDDYGDQLGLLDKHVSPAVAMVIDPRRADDDPQLVTVFYEPEAAVDYLAFARARFEAGKAA